MRRKKASFLFFSAVFILVLFSVFTDFNSSKNKTVTLNDFTVKVELANTFKKQAQGLSGRNNLAEDEGMLFVFNNKKIRQFWMKDMLIPIDIIWINGNKIVGFEKNLLPPKDDQDLIVHNSPLPISYALEVPAGFSDRHRLKIGDVVEFSL